MRGRRGGRTSNAAGGLIMEGRPHGGTVGNGSYGAMRPVTRPTRESEMLSGVKIA
jgi:hypothetical protein